MASDVRRDSREPCPSARAAWRRFEAARRCCIQPAGRRADGRRPRSNIRASALLARADRVTITAARDRRGDEPRVRRRPVGGGAARSSTAERVAAVGVGRSVLEACSSVCERVGHNGGPAAQLDGRAVARDAARAVADRIRAEPLRDTQTTARTGAEKRPHDRVGEGRLDGGHHIGRSGQSAALRLCDMAAAPEPALGCDRWGRHQNAGQRLEPETVARRRIRATHQPEYRPASLADRDASTVSSSKLNCTETSR